MEIKLSVYCDGLSKDDLQGLTRDLSRTISDETSMTSELFEGSGSRENKGDVISIGQIVITALSTGTIVALFNVLKAFLKRESSLEIEFENEDGRKLSIRSRNLKKSQIKKTLGMAETFLKYDGEKR